MRENTIIEKVLNVAIYGQDELDMELLTNHLNCDAEVTVYDISEFCIHCLFSFMSEAEFDICFLSNRFSTEVIPRGEIIEEPWGLFVSLLSQGGIIFLNHEGALGKTGVCCICKTMKYIRGGNNPDPVKKRGRCCTYCDVSVVSPARLALREQSLNT